jgi:co-chaperonin GroES (HSP10)
MSYTSKIHIKVDFKKIRPTRKNILVTDMEFGERKTANGLILLGDDMEERGIRPRWAKVVAVGPENEDVKVGEWIYVAHGRWSRGIDVTNEETGETTTIRMVDPKDVLLSSDEQPRDETVAPSHSYRS